MTQIQQLFFAGKHKGQNNLYEFLLPDLKTFGGLSSFPIFLAIIHYLLSTSVIKAAELNSIYFFAVEDDMMKRTNKLSIQVPTRMTLHVEKASEAKGS